MNKDKHKLEYNGWTNWVTWNFKLWIDNDEKLHKFVYSNLIDYETPKYKKMFLQKVGITCAGTELMSDLTKSDLTFINYEELINEIEEDIKELRLELNN
ncbi:MAG: hypothetical protein Tp1111SUR768151_17 [Prokaryotic dsDNA virus sp.]|nr:MAG: hypothetical protein Tp1111SUR768151_17 [Prokaryotic dsDNA virus sp.]